MSDHYSIFSSGPSGAANAQYLGCELWVRRFRPFVWPSSGIAFGLTDFQAHVFCAGARRLMIHFSGPISLCCVVLHAPCLSARTTADDYAAWWEDTNYSADFK